MALDGQGGDEPAEAHQTRNARTVGKGVRPQETSQAVKRERAQTIGQGPQAALSGEGCAASETAGTLAQKQRTLESHAAAVQKKYDNNEFTTRDEVERAQASIQKEQNDLAELADRLQSEFAMEQARINDEARDSIQSFLKRYNKTKKYDYVMVKAGDNLLIANPKYNITNDIVKGLNKRYKIKPEVAEQIKASREEND